MKSLPSWRLLFSVVLLVQQIAPLKAKADKYRFNCDLRDNPVVTLELVDGVYVRPNTLSVGANETGFLFSANETNISNRTFDFNIVDEDRPKTLEARYCHCWSPLTQEGKLSEEIFFCPVDVSHCGVPATFLGGQSRSPPVCFTAKNGYAIARRLWPSVNFSILALLILLFCSSTGRNVFGCLVSRTMFPCYNERVVDRMIERRPDQANNLIMRHFRHEARREQMRNMEQRSSSLAQTRDGRRYVGFEPRPPEPRLHFTPQDRLLFLDAPTSTNWRLSRIFQREERDTTPRPQSLILKTRIFRQDEQLNDPLSEPMKPPTPVDDADTTVYSGSQHDSTVLDESMRNLNDTACSICYIDIEDGDRVGALPHCNHIFHVDCLKVWLTRRNVCPLCLSEDIATPQFANDSRDATGQESTSQADGEETVNNDNTVNQTA